MIIFLWFLIYLDIILLSVAAAQHDDSVLYSFMCTSLAGCMNVYFSSFDAHPDRQLLSLLFILGRISGILFCPLHWTLLGLDQENPRRLSTCEQGRFRETDFHAQVLVNPCNFLDISWQDVPVYSLTLLLTDASPSCMIWKCSNDVVLSKRSCTLSWWP